MFPDAVAHRFSAGLFGHASGPIFLENLGCRGTESEILVCPQSVPGLHECDHSQDAGVQCYGTNCPIARSVLVTSTCLQMLTSAWLTMEAAHTSASTWFLALSVAVTRDIP